MRFALEYRQILQVFCFRYRNKVKELSDLAVDQPMTGMERTIWWMEYVIRHKGARHLRSAILDLPYYQYMLIDIIGAVTIALIAFVFVVYKIITVLCRLRKSPKIKTT